MADNILSAAPADFSAARALLNIPTGASDAEYRARAEIVGEAVNRQLNANALFAQRWQEAMEVAESQKGKAPGESPEDEEARKHAAFNLMQKCLLDVDKGDLPMGKYDAVGTLWKDRGFKSGVEAFDFMAKFLKDPDSAITEDYKNFKNLDYAAQVDEAKRQRGAFKRFTAAAGNLANDISNFGDEPVLNSAEDRGAPDEVKKANEVLKWRDEARARNFTVGQSVFGSELGVAPNERTGWNPTEEESAKIEAASSVIADYRSKLQDEAIRSEYEGKLLKKNAWAVLPQIISSFKGDDAQDAQECARAILESEDKALPREMMARAGTLSQKNRDILKQIRNLAKPEGEDNLGTMTADAAIGFANTLVNIGTSTYRMSNRWMTELLDLGVDVEEEMRVRQDLYALTGDFFAGGLGEAGALPELQFEQICADHGVVGDALVGAISTLPYMYVAGRTMGRVNVGMVPVALDAMNQFDEHTVAEGGDITNPGYIVRSFVLGGLYSYVEKMQLEKLLGGVSEMGVRAGMLKGMWAGVKNGTVPKVLFTTTLNESVEEGLQASIMAFNEALALDKNVSQEMTEAFIEDFTNSLGTMAVIGAGGLVLGHAKRSGWKGGATGLENRSRDLTSAARNAFAIRALVRSNEFSDAERFSRAEAELFQYQDAWKTGGVKALVKAGLTEERANELDQLYSAEKEAREDAAETKRIFDERKGEKKDTDAAEIAEGYERMLNGDIEEASFIELLKVYGMDAAGAEKYLKAIKTTTGYDEMHAEEFKKILPKVSEDLLREQLDFADEDRRSLFEDSLEYLEALRDAWARGKGVIGELEEGKDGALRLKDAATDPGAAALMALGLTEENAKELSLLFHKERANLYSATTIKGVRDLYEKATKNQVSPEAAFASAVGGRLEKINGETFIRFKQGLVKIEKRGNGLVDYKNTSDAVATSIEKATNGRVTAEQWKAASDAERKEWSKGIVDEGGFTAVAGLDTVLKSSDANKLLGTIRIAAESAESRVFAGYAPLQDSSVIFHETFHGFSRFMNVAGIWSEEDLKKLEKKYGKAREANETFNEENAAEAFRAYLRRRMAGAMTQEDEKDGVFAKLFSFASSMKRADAAEKARAKTTKTAEEAFFDQIAADTYKELGELVEKKPEAPTAKTETGKTTPETPSAPTASTEASTGAPVTPAPAATPAPTRAGAAATGWSAATPTGNVRVKGSWQVFKLSDLIHSNNPLYAKFMRNQLRNRKDNKAEESKREEIINNFDPARLFEAPDTANGAPIVFLDKDENGVIRPFVLSGNGRVLVLNTMAERHLFDQYRNFMRNWAKENGLEVPEGDYVVVRVIEDYGGATREQVADLSNTNSIQQYTEEEQARADAEVIKNNDLARLYHANQNGSADMTPGVNDEFFRGFINGVGDTSLLNSDGSVTESARVRAVRALLAIAVGQGDRGRDVVKKLIEQTDTLSIVRQKNAAVMMAAAVASLENDANYAIGPDVSRAMADFIDFAEKKKAGKISSFADYYAQLDLLDGPSEVARGILGLLGSAKGALEIAEYVNKFVETAKASDADGGLFGAAAARTKTDIWNDVKKLLDEKGSGVKEEKVSPVGSERLSLSSNLFSAVNPYYEGDVRDVVLGVKGKNERALKIAAASMARFVREGDVLVPVPGHLGHAEDTLALAEAISSITGTPVVDALKSPARESVYEQKKLGVLPTAADLGISRIRELPSDRRIVLLDNVVGTGTTAYAAREAAGGGEVLAFAYDVTSPVVDGLSGALVERRSISKLYTGSAADYTKPSLLKVGTGEGSQVYGWGLYATNRKGIAKFYAAKDAAKKGTSERWGKPSDYTARLTAVIGPGFDNNALETAGVLLKSILDPIPVQNADEMINAVKAVSVALKDTDAKLSEMISDNAERIAKRMASDASEMIYEQTFFTNRAPGDESHLVSWYERVSAENMERVRAQAEKEGLKIPFTEDGYLTGGEKFIGKHLYEDLIDDLCYENGVKDVDAPKVASEFLARADIDGVKYPVDSYGKTVKNGDEAGWNYVSFRDDNITIDRAFVDGVERFSIREKDPPKKTGIGYKVFYRGSDGKLYPPMVANAGGVDTPTGVWLDADEGREADKSKSGKRRVKAGGKGTQGGSGSLAYRPGWHLGKIPYALQFNRGEKVPNPLGIKNKKGEVIEVGRYFPRDFVWAEVEYAADVDYQEEATKNGMNPKTGKFKHTDADIKHLPTDGFYEYRTNPNPATDPWIITGAIKVNKILTKEEVDKLVTDAGRTPQELEPERKSFKALDKEYLAAVKAGDTERALGMIREAAALAGYTDDTSYRSSHRAPHNDGYNASLDDVKPMFGTDDRAQLLRMGYGRATARDAVDAIMAAKGNPEAKIKVYRAVSKSVKDENLRPGDWISLSRDYAKWHGKANVQGPYKIIEKEVPAKFIFTDGNMLEEAGFDDGVPRVHKNTKNGTKILGITYDDKGEVIPLSKRFSPRVADERFSFFAGVNGIANLPDALFISGSQRVAREMVKGRDWDKIPLEEKRKIKIATGWEIGADGKWRYEIDDIPTIPMEKLKSTKDNNGLTIGDRHYLSRYTPIKLGDLWSKKDKKAIDLFKAYPFLKETIIIYGDLGLADTTNGARDDANNVIRLSDKNLPTEEKVRSTLTHEIQHAIQKLEDFARGGNIGAVGKMLHKRFQEAKKEANAHYNKIQNYIFDESDDVAANQNFQIWWRRRIGWRQFKANSPEVKAATEWMKSRPWWSEIEADAKRMRKEYGHDPKYFYDSWNEWDYSGGKESYDGYFRLAGEVEARNAAGRINIPREKRRETLAEETEFNPNTLSKIDRKSQILIDDEYNKMLKVGPDAQERHMFISLRGGNALGITPVKDPEAMEARGETRDEIYRVTGWWRAADGKWRVELPFTGKFNREGGPLLRDYFEWPELFNAYPMLSETRVSVETADEMNGAWGEWDAEENTIHIWEGLKKGLERQIYLVGSLVHEMQHAIQELELLAPGGNPAQFDADPNASEKYHRLAGEVEARNAAERILMPARAKLEYPPWVTQDVADSNQIIVESERYSFAEIRSSPTLDTELDVEDFIKGKIRNFRPGVEWYIPLTKDKHPMSDPSTRPLIADAASYATFKMPDLNKPFETTFAEVKNGEERYSIRQDQTRSLIAVHGLRLSSLKSASNSGGLLMPSTAIVDSSMGWLHHGYMGIGAGIYMLFPKSTIDSGRVDYYNGDAYTPTVEDLIREGLVDKDGKVLDREKIDAKIAEMRKNFEPNELHEQIETYDDPIRRESLKLNGKYTPGVNGDLVEAKIWDVVPFSNAVGAVVTGNPEQIAEAKKILEENGVTNIRTIDTSVAPRQILSIDEIPEGANASFLKNDFDDLVHYNPEYYKWKRNYEDQLRQYEAEMAERFSMHAWPKDFPRVPSLSTRSYIERHHHDLFVKGKAGNLPAALELVNAIVDRPKSLETVKALAAAHPNAIYIPVIGVEKPGENALPYAYARKLSQVTPLDYTSNIHMVDKPNHTGADRLYRLQHHAFFKGSVTRGREYIIVDDHITSGATIRDLKNYITERGGKVVAATTLTFSRYSGILSISDESKLSLRKAGITDELLFKKGIAYGIEDLTESEARFLYGVSDPRGRIASLPDSSELGEGGRRNPRPEEGTREGALAGGGKVRAVPGALRGGVLFGSDLGGEDLEGSVRSPETVQAGNVSDPQGSSGLRGLVGSGSGSGALGSGELLGLTKDNPYFNQDTGKVGKTFFAEAPTIRGNISSNFQAAIDSLLNASADSTDEASHALIVKAFDTIASTDEGRKIASQSIDGHSFHGRKDELEDPKRRKKWQEIHDIIFASVVDGNNNPDIADRIESGKVSAYTPEIGRVAHIVVGPPAAGKSSVFVKDLSVYHKARVIDADIIKLHLPGFEGGNGAGYVHEESSYLNNEFFTEAIGTGVNIVVPIVGDDAEKLVKKYINPLKEAGYRVYLHNNIVPIVHATGRALCRTLSTGRWLSPNLFTRVLNKPTAAFEAAKHLVDGWDAFSNDVSRGKSPIFLGSSEGYLEGAYKQRLVKKEEKNVPLFDHASLAPIVKPKLKQQDLFPAERKSFVADPNAVARESFRADLQDNRNKVAENALVNYVAYFKLAHGTTPKHQTIAKLGLAMGMNVVSSGRVLKKADELAEKTRGTLIEKAAGNGDVETAMTLFKRQNDLDHSVDKLVSGGIAAGGQLTHLGVGTINSTIARRVEQMMKDFSAATLADMEGETGLDIAAEILANNPDAFDGELKKAKGLDPEKPQGDLDDDEGSGGGDGEDESSLSDYERFRREEARKAALKKVEEFIAAAKARAEENRRKAEERRANAPDGNFEGGSGDGLEPGSTSGGANKDAPKNVKAGFKSKEEFAAFMRVWAEDRFTRQHGHSTLGRTERERLFAEFYRITVRQELQDLADKLLAPRGARAYVNRRLAEFEKGLKPDTIERMSANIFAFINKAAIRESKNELVKKFKLELKEKFLKGKDFEELKLDSDRRVTGWVEEATRYICRVCDLSRREINGNPSQLARERKELLDILEKRSRVYDESGKEVASAAKEDLETKKALWKLALLDKYGAMTSLMPGEILDLRESAMNYLESEAAKLEQLWKDARRFEDEVRVSLARGIQGPKGQRYQEKGLLNGRLFDALNGMIRLRLKHLTRFAPEKIRGEAENAINKILVLLGDGETAYNRALQDDRAEFFRGLGGIFQTASGRADTTKIRAYLNRMTEAVPVELSRKISNQGFAESMTWGQALQLLVSLEQRSFKDAVKENGREGQAEEIRKYLSIEDIKFVDWLRAFYAAKRETISPVLERMIGLGVDSPDPLYCPVKRWMGDRTRDLHLDPSPRWDAIAAVFSRRVENLRDFDETASVVGMFFNRSDEIAKLVAWAERGTLLRGIFTSQQIQGTIRNAFGSAELGKILKQLEATFNGGETKSKTPGELAAVDKALNFTTYAYLGFNPLSAAKQTTSFTVWANALPGGFKDLWKYMTSFDSKVVKHLKESDEYKVRYGNDIGSGQDMATKGLNANPSANPIVQMFTGASMWLLKKGDFVPGAWIAQGVYKDRLDMHLQEGMEFEAADKLALTETFNLLEETQQSGRTYNTNMLNLEHEHIGRMLTQFATSALQQLQYETQAYREYRDMKRYDMGEEKIAKAREKLLRAVVINHLLLPAAMNFVAAVFKAAVGAPPPWEEEGWHWSLLTEILLGQFSRVFFVGIFSQTALNAFFSRKAPRMGQMLPVEGSLGMATSVAFTAHDLVTLNPENLQKDLRRLLKSSAPTRIGLQVYENYFEDEPKKK